MSLNKHQYKKPKNNKKLKVTDKSRDGWTAFEFDNIESSLVKKFLIDAGVVCDLRINQRHRIWKEMQYYFLKQASKLQNYYGSSGLVEDLFHDAYIVFDDLLNSYIPVRKWTDDINKSSSSKFMKISDAYRIDHYDAVSGEITHLKFSALKQFVNAMMPYKLLDIVQRRYMKYYNKSESSDDVSCDLSSGNVVKSQDKMSEINERSIRLRMKSERLTPFSNIVKEFLIKKMSIECENSSPEDMLVLNYFFIDGFQEDIISEMSGLDKKLVRKTIKSFRNILLKDKQFQKLSSFYQVTKTDNGMFE